MGKYKAVTLWYNLSLACITWDHLHILYIFFTMLYYNITWYSYSVNSELISNNVFSAHSCYFAEERRKRTTERTLIQAWTRVSAALLYVQVRALTHVQCLDCVRSSIQCMSRVTNVNNSICWYEVKYIKIKHINIAQHEMNIIATVMRSHRNSWRNKND